MLLTKRRVEKLIVPEKGQKIVWDDELKGFGIRLTPGAVTYIVQARVNGKSRRVSLGRHGVITIQQARKKAQLELSKMLDGIDPIIEKKKNEALALTLSDLADEYIKNRRELKKSSIADIHKHLRTSFSDWADQPVVKITRDKVAVRFRELTDRSPAQANQAFRNLRALLNFAQAAYRPDNEPLLLENPVKVLSDTKVWNSVKSKSSRIPTDKIGIAWNVIQSERKAPGQTTISRTLADISAFLLLTGARWSEAAQLTWDQVDLDEKWWHLPDPKNRNPVTFPLSDFLAGLLKDRPRTGEYVFPKRSGNGHVADGRGIMKTISEKVNVSLSPHDIRRTFRAIAGECGIELYKTKLLMNHKLSGDVTINSYTETSDLRYLSAEIDKITEWVLRQGKIADSDNVIPLSTKRAK